MPDATQDLFTAVIQGDVAAVDAALKAKADVNARDNYGQTPLIFATQQDVEITQRLIAAGADVNIKNHLGQTPLDIATQSINTHFLIAIELFEHGAKTDKYTGNTLKDLAINISKLDIAETPRTYLNQATADLLADHNRLFFGELHTKSGIQKALLHMMPSFKEQGVGTLSVELKQYQVNDALASSSPEEWASRLRTPSGYKIQEQYKPEDMFFLIKEAQQQGIRVLGHEDPLINLGPENRAVNGQKYNPLSDDGMKTRNRYAAEYIKKHEVSGKKTLALGGSSHSISVHSLFRGRDRTGLEHGLAALIEAPAITALTSDSNAGATFLNHDKTSLYTLIPENTTKQTVASWGASAPLPQMQAPWPLEKAVDAMKRLSGQQYLGHSGNDGNISKNDVTTQIDTQLNWGANTSKEQSVKATHLLVRNALDMDKDGEVALAEIRAAAQRAGVSIADEAQLGNVLNLNNTKAPLAENNKTPKIDTVSNQSR